MNTDIYCVLRLIDRHVRYLGPSIDRVARLLDPGCIYGWGPGVVEARTDVFRRADEFDEWKLKEVQDEPTVD